MKHSLLLLCLLTAVFTARSQSNIYHHFPDSGFVWVEEYTKAPNGWCCCSSTVCTNFYSYQHFLHTDSVVNNLRYVKLFETGYVIRTNSGATVCPPNNYSPCYDYFTNFDCALMREDSTNRQIYIWMPGAPAEELLYDFNMQLGDTVQGIAGMNGNYVSAIDSVQVGNNFHKRFWVTAFGGTQLGYDSAYASITEGLGGSQGVMMPIMPADSSFGFMICAYENNQPVWPANQTGCLLPTGVAPVSQPAGLAVFPNPAHRQMVVYTHGETGSLTLFDLQGKIVHTAAVKQNKTEVQLPALSAGLYTLLFTTDSGHTASKKIVIE